MARWLCLLYLALLAWPSVASAQPETPYADAMRAAAAGDERSAVSALEAGAGRLPQGHIWRERMLAASALLDMRRTMTTEVPASHASPYLKLAAAHAASRSAPGLRSGWLPAVLGTLFPGGGHLWLGRIRDAGVAAMMVLPMLGLTVWAAMRRMGPVTLFFALITLWLWSGTIYSAISLAERENQDAYMLWWNGVWQASGLPGRPW